MYLSDAPAGAQGIIFKIGNRRTFLVSAPLVRPTSACVKGRLGVQVPFHNPVTRSQLSSSTLRVLSEVRPSGLHLNATPSRASTTFGFVVSRTNVARGYRIVLAPAKRRKDDSWVVIPGRTTLTYVVPRSFIPDASLLSGDIRVTADGHRVIAVSIIDGSSPHRQAHSQAAVRASRPDRGSHPAWLVRLWRQGHGSMWAAATASRQRRVSGRGCLRTALTVTPIGCPFPFASTTSHLAGPGPGTRSKNAPEPNKGSRTIVAPGSGLSVPGDRSMTSVKWA